MLAFIKRLWGEVGPNAKWDILKYSGAGMIGALAYLIHEWRALSIPGWTFGLIIFVVALLVFSIFATIARQEMKSEKPESLALKPKPRTTDASNDTGSDNHLIIHSATYGPKGQAGVDRDVTAIVKDNLRCSLTMQASNSDLGGDPAPNFVKQLTVKYSYKGVPYTEIIPENAQLTIPALVSLSPPIPMDSIGTAASHELEDRQRLTLRILNGFVARKQNEYMTMLLLLEVKVDGPATVVINWRLDLEYDKSARVTLYQRLDGAQDYIEYVREGEQNLYRVNPLHKEVPDRGWVLFSVPQTSDEFHYHVFGATFTLTAVEDDEKRSFVKQPPEFWLHKADIIQWGKLGD